MIGIDRFESFQPLRGAVADALAFKEYLENQISVSTERIDVLLNWSARRRDIIQALRGIAENEQINRDDPIIVYFAGYGAEITYTEDDVKRTNQFIIPQDYSHEQGREVPAISDQAIAALLGEVAAAKGENIVGHTGYSLHFSDTRRSWRPLFSIARTLCLVPHRLMRGQVLAFALRP